MLAFIDESGSIHPNDSNPVSVLLAVCMAEQIHRGISRQLYSRSRAILGIETLRELKGTELLNRRTLTRIAEKKELVESVFEMIQSLDITIFSIVIPRPNRPLDLPNGYLPKPHRFLFQRINALAERMNQEAILVYDGNGMNILGMNMASCVSNYIFRVAEPNNILRRIVDTPLFVDSKVTPGIQIADLAASVVRQYETNLLGDFSQSDFYVSAIGRYYRIVKAKTVDNLMSDSHQPLHGFYRMSEIQLYQQTQDE